nr:maestro heat-like repeat-containing protein family member 1 [Chrysemys picta bellii]
MAIIRSSLGIYESPEAASVTTYCSCVCPPSDFHPLLQSLSQLLKVSFEYKIPLPKEKFQAICSALHNQICSQAKPLSTENHAELFDCVVLLACSSPDDLIAFLHSQLEIENKAVRVASESAQSYCWCRL